jgi:hypothetical protein
VLGKGASAKGETVLDSGKKGSRTFYIRSHTC